MIELGFKKIVDYLMDRNRKENLPGVFYILVSEMYKGTEINPFVIRFNHYGDWGINDIATIYPDLSGENFAGIRSLVGNLNKNERFEYTEDEDKAWQHLGKSK